MMNKAARLAGRHWFYLLLPFWLVAALNFQTTFPWTERPALGEAAMLFDWALFMPFLFALCYRDMPRRALVLRTLALVCGGVWVAGRMVPDSAELILTQWGWLRGVGITVLVLFEGIALVAVLRVVFGAAPDPKELERQGIPPIIAKLMLAEARFWRWVWTRMRGH
ncbi:MAG: hypothetical protein LH610_12140 [Sphingomonas bacterium]|nr:hypothetical protein [Sphingomonas bacterium]